MKTKKTMENHVSTTKKPYGDYHGSGIKQKIGKSIVSQMDFSNNSSSKLKKPPKSLA